MAKAAHDNALKLAATLVLTLQSSLSWAQQAEPQNRVSAGLVHGSGAAPGRFIAAIVPGKNDVRLAQWARRPACSRLIRAGVRIFEYEPRTLACEDDIVDSSWSTVGRAKFD